MESLVGWVIDYIEKGGYFGIYLLMTIESSFLPLPSEVAIIPAGYLVSLGRMNAAFALTAGVAGSISGALINYFLALKVGRKLVHWLTRYGRWLAIRPEHLARSETYFARHGDVTTFAGRLLPGIRQLISIPAGLSRMNLGRFVIFTALGSGIWTGILLAVGYAAGKSESLWRPLLQNATIGMVVATVLLIGTYVVISKVRRASRIDR